MIEKALEGGEVGAETGRAGEFQEGGGGLGRRVGGGREGGRSVKKRWGVEEEEFGCAWGREVRCSVTMTGISRVRRSCCWCHRHIDFGNN